MDELQGVIMNRRRYPYVIMAALVSVYMIVQIWQVSLMFSLTTEIRKINHLAKEVNLTCIGESPEKVEDLFCRSKSKTLPNYKNPCWYNEYRRMTCLPYFHLLGAEKCATTDLYYRITLHPEVEPCNGVVQKECFFWAWSRYGYRMESVLPLKAKLREYYGMFTVAAKEIEKHSVDGYHPKVVGDGTPVTFYDFRRWKMIPQNQGLHEPAVLTPHLMKHVYGDVRFIISLRNPPDRLYSEYFFLKHGNSPESFHNDVIVSINLVNSCLKNDTIRACFFSQELQQKLRTRVHLGCYSVFLREWFSVFPRNKFLIINTDVYKQDMIGTLENVFAFLNLSTIHRISMTSIVSHPHKQQTESKRNAKPMFEKTRTMLNDFYHKYNVELYDMLQDDSFLWSSV